MKYAGQLWLAIILLCFFEFMIILQFLLSKINASVSSKELTLQIAGQVAILTTSVK